MRFARRKPLGAAGALVLLTVATVAIFAPVLMPRDPYEMTPNLRFATPGTAGALLGTDHYGRDVLSRLIEGSRTSLYVAVVAIAMAATAGTILGVVSGYAGGKVDLALQRVVDVFMSFPILVLALVIVAVLGQSVQNVIIAIAIVDAPRMSRVVRSVTLSIREQEYVNAARAIGATDPRIMLRHILPQAIAPIIVVATAAMGNAILIEASLSFLGLGTPAPQPSWGSMLAGPTLEHVKQAPWNAVTPGLVLSLTVFSFNLLGDAMRDTLDPRLRR